MNKKSYSVNEVAQRNGLCRQSIYNEINAGRLRSFKVGKSRRISSEAEEKWIHQSEEEAGAL